MAEPRTVDSTQPERLEDRAAALEEFFAELTNPRGSGKLSDERIPVPGIRL